MVCLVIALSINPRPLSALKLKVSGVIMGSRIDTAGDNQTSHVITSNNHSIGIQLYRLSDRHINRHCKCINRA